MDTSKNSKPHSKPKPLNHVLCEGCTYPNQTAIKRDHLVCLCVLHTAPLANGVGDNDGLSVPQEPADAPAPAVYVWFTFLASAVACVAGGVCATPQGSPGSGGSTADCGVFWTYAKRPVQHQSAIVLTS